MNKVIWKDSNWYNVPADPNARTKSSHPYSYDPITQFDSGEQGTGTIYTDRLVQWDFAKHDRLCEEHFGDHGQNWGSRSPTAIQAFLRDWTNDPELQLTKIIEYCNVASGYPTWRLDYKSGGK